jgi:hypothetical protein
MKRVPHALAAFLAVGLGLDSVASAQVPVNLNTWSKKGPAGNGNWIVAADGSNVLQTINGNPTFFVSPNNFINTTVEGSFGVETTGDDDFIGFVFGFKTPEGTGTDFDFLLFDWKQSNQSGSTAGFTLSRVLGNNPQLFNNHQTSQTGYTVLAADVGPGKGWADNVVYGFSLTYRDDRITIGIDGGAFNNQTIFDVGLTDVDPNGTIFNGAFPDGQFGFYNYSQASVRYRGFTQSDDPVLTTTPANGGTLNLPAARVGGASTSGIVSVQNTGGVGSTLTGSIGAASGEISGPGGAFSLAQSASADFNYTFTPSDRGLVQTSVTATGDAPAGSSTITLSGLGVGPVAQLSGDVGGVFDFGLIGSGDTASLILNALNDTSDTGALELVGLSLDYTITGTDSDRFSIDLVAGSSLAAGEAANVSIDFDPDGLGGDFEATLTILTDEGAAFGATQAGREFVFTLRGSSVIPEPAALSGIMVLGAVALRRARA